MKTLGLVLLSTVSLDYVALFFAVDIGLYLLIKEIRDDFIYWLPLKGMTSIGLSLIVRIAVKVIGDFTSSVQLRHPNEVGGAQWVLGQVTTVVTLFIALQLAEGAGKLGCDIVGLWQTSYFLTGAALLSFCIFFSVINEGYIHTFFSLETGGQMTIRAFRTHEDDGLKAEAIFTNNENQWRSIRDEVKEWIWQSWPRWMEEKSVWFDENMRAAIPMDMIPSLEDQKHMLAPEGGKGEKAKGAQGSNSVTASLFGGGRRKSSKYAKVAPKGGEEGLSEEIATEFIEKISFRRGQ